MHQPRVGYAAMVKAQKERLQRPRISKLKQAEPQGNDKKIDLFNSTVAPVGDAWDASFKGIKVPLAFLIMLRNVSNIYILWVSSYWV